MIKLMILGMALVTYLPRLLPLYLLTNRRLNPKLEQFLNYIPYSSLSILIARGLMTTPKHLLLPYTVGIGLAGILAYFKPNLVLAVLTSIAGAFLIMNI